MDCSCSADDCIFRRPYHAEFNYFAKYCMLQYSRRDTEHCVIIFHVKTKYLRTAHVRKHLNEENKPAALVNSSDTMNSVRHVEHTDYCNMYD